MELWRWREAGEDLPSRPKLGGGCRLLGGSGERSIAEISPQLLGAILFARSDHVYNAGLTSAGWIWMKA